MILNHIARVTNSSRRYEQIFHCVLFVSWFVSARRTSGGFKSCDNILKRIEENDPVLETVVFLPMKSFGSEEVARLANAIGSWSLFSVCSINIVLFVLLSDTLPISFFLFHNVQDLEKTVL